MLANRPDILFIMTDQQRFDTIAHSAILTFIHRTWIVWYAGGISFSRA